MTLMAQSLSGKMATEALSPSRKSPRGLSVSVTPTWKEPWKVAGRPIRYSIGEGRRIFASLDREGAKQSYITDSIERRSRHQRVIDVFSYPLGFPIPQSSGGYIVFKYQSVREFEDEKPALCGAKIFFFSFFSAGERRWGFYESGKGNEREKSPNLDLFPFPVCVRFFKVFFLS